MGDKKVWIVIRLLMGQITDSIISELITYAKNWGLDTWSFYVSIETGIKLEGLLVVGDYGKEC